jgi:hypothetical protein
VREGGGCAAYGCDVRAGAPAERGGEADGPFVIPLAERHLASASQSSS